MRKLFHSLLTFSFLLAMVILAPVGIVQADISFPAQINEQFVQNMIAAGGTSTLGITLYNPNSFPLTLSSSPAAFVETLPTGLNFASPANATTTCGGLLSVSGSSVTLTGGTVPAKVSLTPGSCQISVNVTSTIANTYANVIAADTLHATNPDGTLPVTNTDPASVTLTVNSVQPPSLSKTFNPNTMWVGRTSTLSIRITNTDLNSSLTKTSVADTLPGGISLQNVSYTTSNCGSPTITQSDGSALSVGATSVKISNATIPRNSYCNVNFTVTSTTPGVYLNSILANSIQTQQGVTNASAASAPLNVQNIGMTKSFSPTNVQVGGFSTLTVTLQNPSSAAYTGVAFTDHLPSGMTIASPANFATTCTTGGTPASVTTDAVNSTLSLQSGTIPAASSNGTPGSCTVSATVTVTTAGSYTNSIPAGSLSTDIAGVTNYTAATANLSVYGQGMGVSASKGFSPNIIPVGGTSRLTINLAAPADTSLSQVSVTDALPTGLVVADPSSMIIGAYCGSATFAPAVGDSLLTFTGGSIPASRTCSFSVMVTSTDSNAKSYINTISRTNISDKEGRNISGNISGTLTISGLSVTKAFYPKTVAQGGISTLTIQLTNINTDQLNSVNFTDNLPAGLVVATDPNLVNTCGGTIAADPDSTFVSLADGSLPAQVGSVPGICTVNIDVRADTATTKNNKISAGTVHGTLRTSNTQITNPQDATDSLTVSTLTIGVNKSFDPIEVHGRGSSTITISLNNPNNYPLVGIGFTDNLPQYTLGSGISIAPAPNAANTCGGTVIANPGDTFFKFSGGSLAINASCIVNVDVIMDYDGNLINDIPINTVTSTNGGSNDKDVNATLYNSPGASVTKTFSNITGRDATLTITINNLNGYEITGVGLTDPFPTHVSVISADASQCNGTVTSTGNSLSLSGGSLLAMQSCTVVAQVEADSAGSYQNCIATNSLTDDQNATNPEDACDTLTVTDPVTPPQLTKSFSPTAIQLGSNSVLLIMLKNTNTVPLTGVAFTDALPSGMTLTSIPNVSQCAGTVSSTDTSLTLSGGTIAANSSCTVTASVTTSSAGEFENTTGVVTSTNGGDGNSDSATLTVVAPPHIEKSFNSDTISANGVSTLTFTVTNPDVNTVDLHGVAFTDLLPVGVSVAANPNAGKNNCGTDAVFNPTSGSTSLSFSDATVAVGTPCTVQVDVTAANGGIYNNVSNAVTSTNGGTGNTASATLTVGGAGLTLLKSTPAKNYQKDGVAIEYDYLLTNSGTTALYAPFTVNDDHISGGIDCAGGALTLAPGATLTCSANYTTTTDDVAAKSITNIAVATALDSEGGSAVTSNKSSVTIKEAQLTIDKSTSTLAYLSTGDKINYSYTLTNTGLVTLYAPFTVSDNKIGSPKGTAFTCGSTASLAPGANITCTSVYTVVDADITAGTVTNTATATGYDKPTGGTTVVSQPDSVTVNKVDHPTISKVFTPSVIAVGQTSVMSFTILNPNAVPLTGVNFTDTFPVGLSMVTTPDAAQCGGTVSWNSSTDMLSLSSGSIIGSSCTITAVVSADSAQTYTNTTSVVKTTNGGNGNFATANLTVVQGAVLSKSFSPDTILEGATSTLTILLSNPGTNSQTLENVAFTDPFPMGVSIAATPNASAGNCGTDAVFTPSAGDTSLSFSGGNLPVGAICTLKVDVTASEAGSYDNTTSGTTSTNGGNGAPSNTATLNVNTAADLSVTKTDGKVNVSRNEALTYTMVVLNAGPSDAIGATVLDNFPSNLTGVTWVCTAAGVGASCSASGSENINDTVNVPAGTALTYTASATVSSSAVSSILNNIVVYPPEDVTDSNPANNSASDIDSLNLLTIAKSANVSKYSTVGTNITYTYTITNSGTSTLYPDFTVVDDKLTPDCGMLPVSLAPGANFTCTGSHSTTQADLDGGSIVNNVYATATDSEHDAVTSNTAQVTVSATQTPALTLTKSLVDGNHFTAPNQIVDYSYLVKNTGNVTLTAPFAVVDNKTTVDCSSAPASLAPLGTFTCTSSYVVKQTDLDAGKVVNTAHATGKFNTTTVTSNNSSVTAVGDQTLKLTMVKSITSGGTYSALNNVINYSYQLTNAGNVTLSGTGGSGQFTVTDNKTTVTCPVATKTLAPNATVTCTAAYTINQTDLDNGSVTNIATGHSKFSATAVDSNSDTQTATGTQSPALQLTKTIASGNHFTAAGQVVHYNYQLKNTGNVTLTSPFAVSDNKTTVDCSGSPSSLAPQSTYTCTSSYTVLQSDLDTGSVVNLAQATGNFKTTVITSNTDTQTALGVQTEKLTLVKTITSGATYDAVGDVIEYSYLLKNDGNVTLKGTGSAGEFTITDDQTSVTCPATPTSLAPAETVTCTAAYTINQTDLDNGSVTNVATGHSAFGTIPVDSNEDTQTATGTQNPALQLTKSIASGDHFTSAGQIIHYSYLVENIGNVTLAAPFAVSDNKTTVDCSSAPASLAPLGTFTCVSSYTVLQSDLDDGSVVNVAHATGNFKTETITSNEDTQTATGDQTKQLTLVKTLVSGDNYTTVGDILTYSYLLTNSGNVTLTGAGASGEFTVSDDKTSVTCPIATTSLLPNASVTCAATYTVTQDDLDAGKVINVATGHGKFKTESVDSNEDSQQANAVQSPSLTIVKEVSASSSGPWDPDSITVSLAAPVYYRITVKNTGNITLTSVSLDDDTCTVSSPSGDSDGDEKLDVDETWVYTCSVTAEAGTHVNTATVTTDQTSPAADTAGYFAQQPIIGYSKQVSSVQKISAGTYDVTYTILVKNFGNVSLSNLTLTDDMAATFPVPTSYVIRSLTSPQLTVNTGYNGSSDKSLLASGNSLAVGAADSITLVVRVVPTWVGPYNNSISGSGTSSLNVTVTDISQNGDNPDPDDDGNPDNNNTPTPVNFGPTIFEPPMGVKTLDRTQMPVMKWNMIWVNNKNIVPVANTMHDPIPAYTSYIADFTDSGIGVPAGAPTGSTSKGVTCTVSGKSTTSLCYYEGPTASNPRGQIIWQGILAPDYGVTDPTLALNSVNITFSVKFLENATTVKNVATIDTDLNGDGDTNDAGEQQVASASAEWNAQPVALPSTGFAPGVLTTLPEQPKALAYDTLGDMWIEIPGLGLKSTIIGVPQSTDSWNISWLGEDIGWLNGTAFPTHAGNAVLTGHVYNADGQPGPFVDLSQMKYGDEIIIHAWNQSYVYQVRETKTITATNSQAVLEHEDLPWITLLTCRDYDAKSGNYLNRYLVRAVLVKIQ